MSRFFQKPEKLRLKTVIDLRTRKEHDPSPTVWTGGIPPRLFHFPERYLSIRPCNKKQDDSLYSL